LQFVSEFQNISSKNDRNYEECKRLQHHLETKNKAGREKIKKVEI
jgi:hypothetical protein